jgi:C-terminal processing protease CtpA/Prc
MLKRIAVVMILTAFVACMVSAAPAAAGKYEEAKKKQHQAQEKYKKSSKTAWLGVYLQDVTSDIKEAMDLKSKRGALIAGVMDDSPAEEAGIEQEDVVIELDGERVKGTSHLTRLIKERSPGDAVTLKIVRDGEQKSIAVVLGKRPKSKFKMGETFLEDLYLPHADIYSLTYHSGSRIGVKVQSLTEQLGGYFGVEDGQGALITEVEEDMPAEKAGLKAGDVIVEADGEDIEDTGDLVEVISQKEEGDKVEIKVMRDRSPRSFQVEVEKDEAWSSWDKGDFAKMKIFSDKLKKPETFWLQKESSDLEDEMEELKEELEELKEELEEIRRKLR